MQKITEFVKTLQVSKINPNGNIEFLVNSGTKMRTLIKYQNKAKSELTRICNYMNKHIFPNFNINRTADFLKIIT